MRPPDARAARLTVDGRLSTSAARLAEAASDFGGIHHHRPVAVLKPASVRDVSRIVEYARAAGLKVAARGRGHSTCGQAQADGGIVIDMRGLATVHRIDATTMDVDAGATWKQVLDASLVRRLMPPVLPDYLQLTVGGLISLGGIGYQTCRFGAVVDHVSRLTVVTGTGEVLECSQRLRPDLFRAARGGLGQFGVIVRARLRLIAAPPLIRFSRYLYADAATLLRDLRRVARDRRQRFDTVCAFDIPNEKVLVRDVLHEAAVGVWIAPWMTNRLFVLQLGQYCSSASAPDTLYDADELACLPGVRYTWVDEFGPFADRASEHQVHWKRSGLWDVPHPWLNVILPGAATSAWLERTLRTLDPLAPSDGPIMMYPVVRHRSLPSMLRMPGGSYSVRVDVLRAAVPSDRESVARLLRANRRLYAECLEWGGVHYPSAALDMRTRDWQRHFGPLWKTFTAIRNRYDPKRLFAPGQGIVTSTSNRA